MSQQAQMAAAEKFKEAPMSSDIMASAPKVSVEMVSVLVVPKLYFYYNVG